jgi:hypothetical protein
MREGVRRSGPRAVAWRLERVGNYGPTSRARAYTREGGMEADSCGLTGINGKFVTDVGATFEHVRDVCAPVRVQTSTERA